MKHQSLNIRLGAILAYANVGVSVIVNIFFVPFLLKNVGDAQYGLYSFATSMTSMLTVLSFGMTSAYTRFATIARKEAGENGLKKINSVFFLFFLFASFIALIVGGVILLLMFSGVIPLSSYSDSQKTIIFILFSLSLTNVFVNFISYIFTLNINLNLRYIWARSITLMSTLAIPLISLPLISATQSITVYCAINLLVNIVALLLNVLFCIKFLRFKFDRKISKSDLRIFKRILFFSFYVFLVSIVTQIDAQTDKILLGFFADAETVAIYQLGFSLVNYISIASTTVCSLYIPVVNKQVVNNDEKSLHATFLSVSSKMQILYIFVIGGFISCGSAFILAWLGDSNPLYRFVYFITISLSLINLIPFTMNLSSEVQRAMNLHKFRALTLIAGAFTNIVLTVIILTVSPYIFDAQSLYYPIYQIFACITCTGIATIVFSTTVMAIYNQKVIKLPIGRFFIKLAVNLIPGIIGSVTTILVFSYIVNIGSLNPWIQTIILGGFYFLIFIVSLFVLYNKKIISFIKCTFNKQEKKIVIQSQKNDNPAIIKHNVIFKEKGLVLGIDDCNRAFENLKKNEKRYSTFFDEPLFKLLMSLNKDYGIKFTLFIQNCNKLHRLKKTWIDDFKNIDWLKFGFHSGTEDEYSFIDSPLAKPDYDAFVFHIKRLFGREDLIDRFVRLHKFLGSKTALQEMAKLKCGPLVYLTADDDMRKSYYLDDDSLLKLNKDNYYEQDGLLFVKCRKRLDEIFDGKKMEIISSSLPTFIHEWELYNSDLTINISNFEILKNYCSMIFDSKIKSCFLEDNILIEAVER